MKHTKLIEQVIVLPNIITWVLRIKIIMNNPYRSRRNSELPPRKTFSIRHQIEKKPRLNIIAKTNDLGLNSQFLRTRKENHLNTGYNIRKQLLEKITLQNRKIYLRINSQKTIYSRGEMNKSYESNSSISRRLSESKISKRESSRASMRSSSVKRPEKKKVKPKQNYIIKTTSIANMNGEEINKLKNLFPPNYQSKKPYCRKISTVGNLESTCGRGITLPPISEKCNEFAPRQPLSTKNEGAFLHKIADEMFLKRKGRP